MALRSPKWLSPNRLQVSDPMATIRARGLLRSRAIRATHAVTLNTFFSRLGTGKLHETCDDDDAASKDGDQP